MHVDPDGLRNGANSSLNAAVTALRGAATLSRAVVSPSVFGDFAEARSFHQAVSGARVRHVGLLNKHHENLGDIGDKAHAAAASFAETEERNAAMVRSVSATASH